MTALTTKSIVFDFMHRLHKFYFYFQDLILRMAHINRWPFQDCGLLDPY